jgi:hypothetical protein
MPDAATGLSSNSLKPAPLAVGAAPAEARPLLGAAVLTYGIPL